MTYRICKSFEVESGHLLSKHAGACRYPHGHSRRIEIVLASESLDGNDMVCDFAAVKFAVRRLIDRLDHTMAVNSRDPLLSALGDRPEVRERLLVFPDRDPTTEVLARYIHDYLVNEIAAGREFSDPKGQTYRLPAGVVLERVRVSETSTTWAEYGR